MGLSSSYLRGLITLCFAAVLLSSTTAEARWATERRQDLAAETLDGGAGLFHTRSATQGAKFELRLGVHFEYFNKEKFIVENWPNCANSCPNEVNERHRGAVTFGATLWRYLEVFGAVYYSRNTSYRNHLEPTDEPETQTIAGDFAVGLKAFLPVDRKKALVLGGLLAVKAHTGLGDIKHRPEATTVSTAFLLSFRADRVNRHVPFRVHLNIGYVRDPSHRVLGSSEEEWTPGRLESSEAHHRYLVRQFALNLNTSHINIRLGFEFPFRFLGGFLNPIIELQIDWHTHDPNEVLTSWPEYDLLSDDTHVVGRVASRFVTGFRIRPAVGLVLDVGIDVRMRQRGHAHGPPLPPWNVFFQLGYVFRVDKRKPPPKRRAPMPF